MSAMTVATTDLGWRADGRVPQARSARRSPAQASAPLRLTARGRGVLVALALALAAAWTFAGPGAHAGVATPATEITSITVAPGQTLWQVASTVASPDEDVRDVVDELIALNGLSGAALQAGQQLLVPVASR